MNYELAKQIAMVMLDKKATNQSEDFDAAIEIALRAFPDIDAVELRRELEAQYSVFTPDASVLSDPTGHEEWLQARQLEIEWDFWERYRTYLLKEKQMPPLALQQVHSLTDDIIGFLEDPKRAAPWDRRGMVVGQVQSGKTANYTGLICKAADAGYKLIIVLAGIHNSLRSQTQLRLDEGFLGKESVAERLENMASSRIGVGRIRLPGNRNPAAHTVTTSAEKGDFKRAIAEQTRLHIGNDPVILVIKKNGTILRHLIKWVRDSIAEGAEGGAPEDKRVRGNIPLLLIDDEADNASINTKELSADSSGRFHSTQDVTRINSLIRQLLLTFDASAYVGYTATPFANIFIHPEGRTDKEGDDLFPRSFIINLHPPSNYIGPVQVFGLDDETDEGEQGLPIVRRVIDSESIFPSAHKQTLRPSELPQSLHEALRAFLLTCAARAARGQTKVHNSMLIHVTRYVAVQGIVKDLVGLELDRLRRRLENGDGGMTPTLRDELRTLWEQDFMPTMAVVSERIPDDYRLVPLQWEEVEPHLVSAVSKIQVKQINGTATDILDYYDKPDGLNVIAIGGDKLSRGLTLEGLSVSYYLRASRTYDTLMQMGRWFGYRPGYADLCRLYTTPELIENYEHITLASEELRKDFDKMQAQGATPADFGLRVRTHSSGLTVTSAGKIRYGTAIRVSFTGTAIETHRLSKKAETLRHNFQQTVRLIDAMGAEKAEPFGASYIWRDIPAEQVEEFLRGFQGVQENIARVSSQPDKLAEFIQLKRTRRQELTNWTVILIGVSNAQIPYNIGNVKNVGMPLRTPSKDSTEQIYALRNRRIMTQSHEWLDLTPDQRNQAAALRTEWARKKDPQAEPFTEPDGASARAVRPLTQGLLLLYPLDPSVKRRDDEKDPLVKDLFPDGDPRREGVPVIGFAVSFPGETAHANDADAVEYIVNTVYMKEEQAGLQAEEELNYDGS